MNRYIVHLGRVQSFGMQADSIYDVETYVKQDLNIKSGFCITHAWWLQ